MAVESSVGRFGSGQAVLRIEDKGLLTGAGVYAGDVSLPGLTHLFFLRSPHAHARIVSLDISAARRLPGVVAILTGEDLVKAGVKPIPLAPAFQRPDGSPATTPPRRALAFETVRFVGEAVAAVVADTYAQARDAAEAIEVEYDELPAVVDIDQAVAADAQNVIAADAPRRRRGRRCRFQAGGACRRARADQSAPGGGADGAAQHHQLL